MMHASTENVPTDCHGTAFSALQKNLCASSHLLQDVSIHPQSISRARDLFELQSTHISSFPYQEALQKEAENAQIAQSWANEILTGSASSAGSSWLREFNPTHPGYREHCQFQPSSSTYQLPSSSTDLASNDFLDVNWTDEFNKASESVRVSQLEQRPVHRWPHPMPTCPYSHLAPSRIETSNVLQSSEISNKTSSQSIESMPHSHQESYKKSSGVVESPISSIRAVTSESMEETSEGQNHEYYDFPQWAQDYYQNISSLITEEDIKWEKEQVKLWRHFRSSGFGYEGFAAEYYKDYFFEVVHTSHENSLGDKIMNSSEQASIGDDALVDGRLADAVMAYEKWLLQDGTKKSSNDPLSKYTEVYIWWRLFESHYLSGRDDQAISCAQRALSLSSSPVSPLKCSEPLLLCLTTAYLNEKCLPEALSSSLQWLMHDEKRRTIAEKVAPPVTPSDGIALWIRVIRTLVEQKETIDGPLQIGLALLLSMDKHYDLAKDCLQSALLHDPDNIFLLNKLGSYLTNMCRYEEAIDCYNRSIQTQKDHFSSAHRQAIYFIRPFRNLALARMACGRIREALGAIKEGLLHCPFPLSSERPSDLWETLKIVLMNDSELSHLAERCSQHDMTLLDEF